MRSILALALAAAVLAPAATAAQAPALVLPAAGTTSARLGRLETQYIADRFRDQPTSATQSGFHAYDDRLPDMSAAAYAARLQAAHAMLASLAEIERSEKLNAEDAADAVIMRSALESTVLAEREGRWRHNPAQYTGVVSGAVYGLFSRDFAPLETRMRSAIARERAIPALLAQGKANITTVDAVTAELAKRNIAGSVAFFEKTVPQAFAAVADASLQAQLKASNDAAIAALRDFQEAMNAGPLAHPSGTYAIGAETYAQRLALQEGAPISLATYEAVGQKALDETKAAFVATAKQIDPSRSAADVYTSLGRSHPAPDALIPTAQDELNTLKAFVLKHDLVTLAPEWNVKVLETPVFDRETSLASMSTPGAFEKVATQAYYYVTPVDPAWTAAQREGHLSFYNDYAFPIISAHEVMPGHYENFVWHKFTKLSLVRALSGNPSYSEGWAHYDEQMMVDEGWGAGDPKVRLAQLSLALQREARYLVGLREHTQGMTVDEGTKFFVDNAFMPEIVGRREALRGTQDPLYGYYTLGKLEILKLRDDYKKLKGPAYTLKGFHDAFLAHGNPPIAVVRKLLLGSADDGKLL